MDLFGAWRAMFSTKQIGGAFKDFLCLPLLGEMIPFHYIYIIFQMDTRQVGPFEEQVGPVGVSFPRFAVSSAFNKNKIFRVGSHDESRIMVNIPHMIYGTGIFTYIYP